MVMTSEEARMVLQSDLGIRNSTILGLGNNLEDNGLGDFLVEFYFILFLLFIT